MRPNNSTSHEHSGTTLQTTEWPQTTLWRFCIRCDGGIDDRDDEDSLKPESRLPSLTPSVRDFFRAGRGRACEICDTTEAEADLQIHHRTPQSEGGSNHPENLLLLCDDCHKHHHGNQAASLSPQGNPSPDDETVHTDGAETPDNDETTSSAPAEDTAGDTEPLPPRSEPNGADESILKLIEEEGPLRTGDIAAATDYSKQHIRRECWKLAGEQLIAPRENNTWDLTERTDSSQLQIGLPDSPKSAARAGRDEVIRKMSAHGLSHTEIADITNLSRRTIDIAVDRARALQVNLDEPDDEDVNLAAIATRLSALVELIDHTQIS